VNQIVVTAIAALASAFVGGGVWTFASAWLGQSFSKEQSEIKRVRADLTKVQDAHKGCEERVATLERRLESVEHHHASLLPRWIKDANKRIRWINGAAMVSVFGPLDLARDQVEGHTFAELLDMEAARELDRTDRAALARPGMPISTLLQLHSKLPLMHIVKVAGAGRDGELVYEGYAYCMNDPADALDRGVRRAEEQLGLSTLRMQGPAPDDPA
jgi:hypothetical protein